MLALQRWQKSLAGIINEEMVFSPYTIIVSDKYKMKGFFGWFKGSTKIKRWMFLILIGLVLTCFGFSKMLTSERLELKDLIVAQLLIN